MDRLLEKDPNTYEHSIRVGQLCEAMAERLNLHDKQANVLILGGYLHDIGKIFVPDDILLKDSALSASEWEVMRQHTRLGASKLLEYEGIDRQIAEIIELHHERLNGQGYPYGLSGGEIPVLARICAIVDSFDCMVSDRPYRKGLSFREAVDELQYHSGTQFDSDYVRLFVTLSPSYGGIYTNHY
ncbi:HD-GYP domain-containing protein [Paenibacillus thalictri]|uniref:HD-GYP domain-containing protein n=2 Tax=Paenibacillus thalictri TaxID=2527873 RepID=A0A4Q9DJX6_9BACL|nr:HD-GYP domain-containing protein [Paenibacillus thalictri]